MYPLTTVTATPTIHVTAETSVAFANAEYTQFYACGDCGSPVTVARIAKLAKDLTAVQKTYTRLNARPHAPQQYPIPETYPVRCARCTRIMRDGDQS